MGVFCSLFRRLRLHRQRRPHRSLKVESALMSAAGECRFASLKGLTFAPTFRVDGD